MSIDRAVEWPRWSEEAESWTLTPPPSAFPPLLVVTTTTFGQAMEPIHHTQASLKKTA